MIDLNSEQARVIDEALHAGIIHSVNEALTIGLNALRDRLESTGETMPQTLVEASLDSWDRDLEEWFEGFPHSHVLPETAFHREDWYPDRW